MLRSCHTVDLDGALIEGHVPVEAIDELLADDGLAGIAIPGMPRDAPGMGDPGDPLEVLGFTPDGEVEPFTTV